MESLEITAPTVEKAIQRALAQLGLSREEVEVTVLNEGRRGLLGLGNEEAKIRVCPLAPAAENTIPVADTAKSILEQLLAKLEFTASVLPDTEFSASAENMDSTTIAFDIKGQDLGGLIGRRGQTLSALQYLVRLIANQQTKHWTPIIIDVEGYKKRRYEALRTLALHIAEQVKTKKTLFRLEPMPAFERRIIHLTLANHPDVTTQSIGEGELRRVVISLKT